ncbi:PilN domain-containing protein [Comamonas flocculans]|uniref:PilN domain-containing protein n=1 Tax=Comamonas flocculans TaxID=2597701 RepID=A0A5B8RYE4_9BURK|nr:PilN domain-containing protein [Comamonas flocculans]QEA13235.1 PilN domain-containing protein [Comamonas flocculans]
MEFSSVQLWDNRNLVNSVPTSAAIRSPSLDWRALWLAVCRPWRRASGWPWVRLLTPAHAVTLIDAGGGRQTWSARLDGEVMPAGRGAGGQAQWTAVALPQTLVLQRALTLPAALDAAQVQRALELEAGASSPFSLQDLCWGYVLEPAAAGQRARIVLTSRQQIAAYLRDQAPIQHQVVKAPEVWAPLEDQTSGYVVLPGYGEVRRQEAQRKGRGLYLGALVLLLVLLVCIAITPTLQLRAQAIEAVRAYDELHARASQAVAAREALVGAMDRLAQVENLERASAPAARIVNVLTTLLGDDTYLAALRIQGTKVSLDGQTSNAAQLMQALGHEPGIEEVTAPVPATRPFGSGKDMFKIEFRFDPKVFGVPSRGQQPAVTPVHGEVR